MPRRFSHQILLQEDPELAIGISNGTGGTFTGAPPRCCSPHLKHVAVIILDAVLPELLQREHAANAHFVKDLLHDIRKRGVPQPSFSIHSKAQQLGELQAVLVGDVCQRFQDALVGTLEARVSQDGGHGLVEKLPAGGPTQLSHWLSFPPKNQERQKEHTFKN